MAEVILFPGGGLNQEDSVLTPPLGNDGHSLFEAGDYRYALNCRIGASQGTNTGALENLPSTLLVNSYYQWNGAAWVSGSAPAGTNTALNKYEDRTDGKIYWFIKNSNGNDAILMFVKSERKIYELIQWSGFHFSNPIASCKINKYLIFTDGNPADSTGNAPRIIDVTTIYTLKSTLNTNFSEYHISFAKWAPVDPPTVELYDNLGNVFIKKGIRQFAYRFIYIGGFRSCWSPPSYFVSNELLVSININNPTPRTGFSWNFLIKTPGFIYDSNTPANTAFDFTDPRFYQVVEFIEYAYRESQFANWKVFERVSINTSSFNGQIVFYDNGPAFNVADNDIGQYFDAVPLLSRAVDAIDNRPMFGNNLDDLAPISNFDVTNVEIYSVQKQSDNWYDNVSTLVAPLSIRRMSFKENGVYKLGLIGKNKTGRSGLVQTVDKWSYTIPVNSQSNPQCIEDMHALGFKIPNSVIPADWMVDYQIVRSNCLNVEMFILGIVNDIRLMVIDAAATSAASDNSASMTTPIRDSISAYFDNANTGGAQYSTISRIIAAVRRNAQGTVTTATLIYFDISNWSLDVDLGAGIPAPPSNAIYYNWAPGDRIRFWSNSLANMTGTWTQHDQEIIEYGGTSLVISRPQDMGYTKQRRDGEPVPANKTYTIEVYRPKKYSTQNDVIFYEMGEWYPVTQPGTANRDFSKRDFTWSGSGSVSTTTVGSKTIYNKFPIINGDVWLVTKNFYRGTGFFTPPGYYLYSQGFMTPFVGSSSILNFTVINDYAVWPQMTPDRTNASGIWEHNNGRPLVAYRYLPKQFEKSSQVRFGGKFLEDSLFIGINNFQEANQFLYPTEYGKIRALVNTSNTTVKNVGNILLAIGEEETWSIYVNRTTLEDLSGRTQVSLSDKVLGSYNTLLGSYGTLNPESISKKNSRVIFWSGKQGKWIRYSDDGLTPISDVKMYNWFNDLSILLLGQYGVGNDPKAITVFDNYYDEWITYLNHSSLPSTYRGYSSYKCVSFSEDDKRWRSVYDYTPELFAALENETYSIIGSTIHVHFEGTDFNSIYGVKKDSYWQPVANSQFRRTKVWEALGLQATDKWSFTAIEGDIKSNGANIQLSSLLLSDLQVIEEMYWSDLKRNQNTPNVASTDEGLIQGNPMRSRSLTLMLKLDPAVTWLSVLNWLVVKYNISELTVKK